MDDPTEIMAQPQGNDNLADHRRRNAVVGGEKCCLPANSRDANYRATKCQTKIDTNVDKCDALSAASAVECRPAIRNRSVWLLYGVPGQHSDALLSSGFISGF
jgi:hypothetical protein